MAAKKGKVPPQFLKQIKHKQATGPGPQPFPPAKKAPTKKGKG